MVQRQNTEMKGIGGKFDLHQSRKHRKVMERLRFDSKLTNLKSLVAVKVPEGPNFEESEYYNENANVYGLGDEPGPV